MSKVAEAHLDGWVNVQLGLLDGDRRSTGTVLSTESRCLPVEGGGNNRNELRDAHADVLREHRAFSPRLHEVS